MKTDDIKVGNRVQVDIPAFVGEFFGITGDKAFCGLVTDITKEPPPSVWKDEDPEFLNRITVKPDIWEPWMDSWLDEPEEIIDGKLELHPGFITKTV